MFKKLGSDVRTVANAHVVDGKHAVGAAAIQKARAGTLVATDWRGHLPNDLLLQVWS